MDILVGFFIKLNNNLFSGNIIFICIKFLQIMNAFWCLVKTDPNLSRLPVELLLMIEPHYIKSLIKKTKEIIHTRKQNKLYQYLRDDIIYYGGGYTDLCQSIHSNELRIPESTNIIKGILDYSIWNIVLPKRLHSLHSRHELREPKWSIQLRKRLHLKYNTDFVHCLSQLKRFADYFKQGDLRRILQFGYNLGRLQEISTKKDHTIFWCPVERLILEEDWIGLDAYIDTIQKRFQIGYDQAILKKAK